MAMDVDTILDREYNIVGGAEVIKLHQLIFEFGAIQLVPAFQCYACNIEKLGVAWGRGYERDTSMGITIFTRGGNHYLHPNPCR